MKKIKLLKDWMTYKAGTVLEVDEATFKTIPADTSEAYVEAPPAPDLDAIATKAVSAAIAQFEKTNKGSIKINVTRDESAVGFKSFGEQLLFARESACSGGRVSGKHFSEDPRFKVLVENIRQKAPGGASGMSEAVDSDGGFLVQTDFAAELWQLAQATGVLVGKVQHVPISSNANGLRWNAVNETSRADGSRKGGLTVYWTNEATAATASKAMFAERKMDLEKLTGAYYATEELLADSSALGGMVSSWFSEEFGFKLDDAILRGSGAGQPLGVLNSPALVSVAKESGQAADTLVAENIVKMYARMYTPSIPRAVWYMNQNVLPQLLLMKMTIGTAGQPLYMPPGGLSQSPYGTIMGRPVMLIEQASTIGDQGDVIFADLGEYLMIDKGGVNATSSIHLKFLEGETCFRFALRTNGQPKWRTAQTPARGTSTSPFVTLDAR